MLAELNTHNESETMILGERIGATLKPGDVIALTGDLGAGKTTLTKGIAHGLGVESEVASPTFTIIHEHRGKTPLYHIDLYRLESEDLLADLGLEEYLYGQGVTVVEWAERMEGFLPASALRVHLSLANETERDIQLSSSSDRWTVVIEELTKC